MPFRKTLRADLVQARKTDDPELVSLLKTLIAAIENAEAVDPEMSQGVTEAPRCHLSDGDILDIILRTGDDLRHAADEYESRGSSGEARRLRALSKVADHYARAFQQSRTSRDVVRSQS